MAMTEDEYIKAYNKIKLSIAISMLRETLPGEEYGINENEIIRIISLLTEMHTMLRKDE